MTEESDTGDANNAMIQMLANLNAQLRTMTSRLDRLEQPMSPRRPDFPEASRQGEERAYQGPPAPAPNGQPAYAPFYPERAYNGPPAHAPVHPEWAYNGQPAHVPAYPGPRGANPLDEAEWEQEGYYDEDPYDGYPEPEPPDHVHHAPRYVRRYEVEDVQTQCYLEKPTYGEGSEPEAPELECASRGPWYTRPKSKEDHGGGPWFARYPRHKPEGDYWRETSYASYPHPKCGGGSRLSKRQGNSSFYGTLNTKPSYSPWRSTHYTSPRHEENHIHLPKESTHTNVSLSADLKEISTALKDIQHFFEKTEHLTKSTIVKKGLGSKKDLDQTNCSNLRIKKMQENDSDLNIKTIEVQLSPSVYNDSMTSMMHLPSSRSVETGTGHEEGNLSTSMTITCQGQPREQAETELDNPPELSPSEPYPMEQRLPGKSYDPLSSLKVICYRCQGLGHIAKVCPFKSLVKGQSLEKTNRKNCENSVELNTPNASISHLSLPKDVEIGLGVTSKETAPARSVDHTSKPELTPLLIQPLERKTESDLRTLLIKEEPPDSCQGTTRHQAPELGVVPAAYSPSQFEAGHDARGEEERPKEKHLDHDKNTKSVQRVSLFMTPIVSHDATVVLKSLLNIRDHEETTFLKLAIENEFAISSAKELGTISLPCPKEPMMHLFLAQKVNLIAGTKEVDHKGVPPQENLLRSQVQDQRTNEPMKTFGTSTKEAAAKSAHSRGVILSYLLKEEPPDVPSYAKPLAYPGKTLNSQRRMKANLLSIVTGQTVLRTKLFEGGGDDARLRTPEAGIRSLPAKEHGEDTQKLTKTLGENQPGRTKDIGALIGSYRSNQMELSYESTCSRKSTHQGITERKNWFKRFPQDEDIQLPSWQTANDREGDQRLPIEGFQSNQDEPSRKPTCFGNSTHQRCKTNWIHAKMTYGLKVIQLLNQETPDLPCLGAHEFEWPPRPPLLLMHDMEVFHTSQKVPRHHLYLPKLSRYKGHSKSC